MPDVKDFQLARNVRRIGHLDLPGGGQVVVDGDYAYVGHMKPPHGTSIVDVSDPARPRVVAQIGLEGDDSHTHKVRVVGDLMFVNVEQNERHFRRKGDRLPALRADLKARYGRQASDQELAAALGVERGDILALDAARERGYDQGGFKIYDVSDRTSPKLIHYEKTFGFGVHRFDVDQRYAYISTEMEGYLGNILVIYEIQDPARPEGGRGAGGGVLAPRPPRARGQGYRAAGGGRRVRLPPADPGADAHGHA